MPGIGCGAAQKQDTPFAAACKPHRPAQIDRSVCLGAYTGRKTTPPGGGVVSYLAIRSS